MSFPTSARKISSSSVVHSRPCVRSATLMPNSEEPKFSSVHIPQTILINLIPYYIPRPSRIQNVPISLNFASRGYRFIDHLYSFSTTPSNPAASIKLLQDSAVSRGQPRFTLVSSIKVAYLVVQSRVAVETSG